MGKLYLGVDLGGTNTVAAVVDENRTILAKAAQKTDTASGAEKLVDDICALVRRAAKQACCSMSDFSGLGIGTPGLANSDTGMVECSANLPFDRFQLEQMVKEKICLATWICNDANAAALGEWLCGQYQDCSSFVLVTLGTGIGCGMILQRSLYTGVNFAAGELGHMVVQPGGLPCGCGRSGCFEMYASASGLIHMTKTYMRQAPNSVLWSLCGGQLEQVTGKTSFDGLRAGDETAASVVREYIDWLALGLANLVNLLQPEILCIGGGLSNEGETLLEPLRREVFRREYARNAWKRTKLVSASLKNDAGLVGAALFPRYCQPGR
ncbi:MAG: ROK family protein [Oscillospiraceae bacterium]|jgi:glucokinase